MKEEEAIEDLKLIKKILDKLKIPFFLNFGTLLGAYRDGKFLPDDKDIDIGILGIARRPEIMDALEKEGFIHRIVNKSILNLYIIRKVPVDIHLFKDMGKCYLDGASLYRIPKKFTQFKKLKFIGRNFLIPKQTKEYLVHYYGEKWDNPNDRTRPRKHE